MKNKFITIFCVFLFSFNFHNSTQAQEFIFEVSDLEIIEKGTIYNYLMESCNYISRLTDGNALQVFQKIKGNL